jgi:hypothetical protein
VTNPAVVHSTLSFSGRKRWRECPISVHLSKDMPDSSGPAAAEGTCAHTVGEFYVRQRFNLPGAQPGEAPLQEVPEGLDLKGKTVDEWNEELRTHGRAYASRVASLIATCQVEGEQFFVDVEQKVAASTIHPQLFGTLDLRIWFVQSRRLVIIDYKFGYQDVDVGTVDDPNAQLAAYAVASMDKCTVEAEAFTLAVFQPRVPLGSALKVLDLPKEWLQIERAKLRNEVAAVDNPGAPRPGDHCRYCKGKSKCPATYGALQTAIDAHAGKFDILSIDDDDLITLFAARTAVKALWEDVEERINGLVKAGHKRLAISERQGRQMWADPQQAALTFMAMNMTNLLQPIALSEALPHLPEAFHAALVKRSAPSRSIKIVDEVSPGAIAGVFQKYANKA